MPGWAAPLKSQVQRKKLPSEEDMTPGGIQAMDMVGCVFLMMPAVLV